MKFFKCEDEGHERINLEVAGFDLPKKDDDRNYRQKKGYTDVTKDLTTTSTLLTSSFKQYLKKHCVFCNGKHLSSKCFATRKISFTEKQDKKCFFEFGSENTTKQCIAILRCFFSYKQHSTVMY